MALALSLPAAQRCYPDDPLAKEPAPLPVGKVNRRPVSDYYDLLKNTFHRQGERNSKTRQVGAQSANTLGEVPDSPWYTNRIGRRTMTTEALVRGPGNQNGPSTAREWRPASSCGTPAAGCTSSSSIPSPIPRWPRRPK